MARMTLHEHEDRWDEKKCRHGSQDQSPDNSAPEGCVLFTSLTHGEGHRDHPDDHGEGRHEDWSQTGMTSFQSSTEGIATDLQAFVGEGDHQNTVSRGYPHAHDRPHQGRHTQCSSGDEEHPNNACQSRRQRRDNDERFNPSWKFTTMSR